LHIGSQIDATDDAKVSIFSLDFSSHYDVGLEFTKDSEAFVLRTNTKIELRDAKTGKSIRTLHDGAATAVAIAPRSGVLAMAVGSPTSFVEIWDLAANKKLHTFEGGHQGTIASLAFSDDEAFLLSGGNDTTAIVWDFKGIVK
jgi:WD40 repeat protein